MNKCVNALAALLLCANIIANEQNPENLLKTMREQINASQNAKVYSYLMNWNKNYNNNAKIKKEDIDSVILEHVKTGYDLTLPCTTAAAVFTGIISYILTQDKSMQKISSINALGYIFGAVTAVVGGSTIRNALHNKKETGSYVQTSKNHAYIVFDKESNNWKVRYHQDYELPQKVRDVTPEELNQIAQEIIASHEVEEHVPSEFFRNMAAHIFENK